MCASASALLRSPVVVERGEGRVQEGEIGHGRQRAGPPGAVEALVGAAEGGDEADAEERERAGHCKGRRRRCCVRLRRGEEKERERETTECMEDRRKRGYTEEGEGEEKERERERMIAVVSTAYHREQTEQRGEQSKKESEHRLTH